MNLCALISVNRYIFSSLNDGLQSVCAVGVWEFYCDVTAAAAYFSVASTKVGNVEWELIISPAFYNVIFSVVIVVARQRAKCCSCCRLQSPCAMVNMCSWIRAKNNCFVKCE